MGHRMVANRLLVFPSDIVLGIPNIYMQHLAHWLLSILLLCSLLLYEREKKRRMQDKLRIPFPLLYFMNENGAERCLA